MAHLAFSTSNIIQVIARAPIPPGQITLFKALYEAGDHWLSKYELAREIRGGDEKSVLGVLGALGTRVNYTPELRNDAPGIGLLFETKVWHDEWHYRLLPETRAAIEALPDLRLAMSLTVQEIHERFSTHWLVAGRVQLLIAEA